MIEKLTNISKITGLITGIAAALGVLWGVFRFIDITQETAKTTQELTIKFDTLSFKVDNISAQNGRVNSAVMDLNLQIQDMKVDNDRWHRSYLNYIKDNTKTSQDLFKYLEGLDLKKN